MSSDVRHQLGKIGEGVAVEHLERRGLRILERNYRTRWGELDIVALDRQTLVFCEVKARRSQARDRTPLEAVHPTKRAQVRRMAASWLAERKQRPYVPEMRFDAIGVTFDASGRLAGVEHLEGAF